jgi:hypothetical protein
MDDANYSLGLDFSDTVGKSLESQDLTLEEVREAIGDPQRVAAYDAITNSTILMGRTGRARDDGGSVVVTVLEGENPSPQENVGLLRLLSVHRAVGPEVRLYEEHSSVAE